MKLKITRPDGTVLECEGTVEECSGFAQILTPPSSPYTSTSQYPFSDPFKPSDYRIIYSGLASPDNFSYDPTQVTFGALNPR